MIARKHIHEHTVNVNFTGLDRIIELLFHNNQKLEKIMATQAELAAQLRDLGTELGKIGGETTTLLQKISDLEAQIANLDNVTPELQAAFDAVKQQAQTVDDLVPDAPTS